MKNIHTLPTDKPSRLAQSAHGYKLHSYPLNYPTQMKFNRHIYITNDEKIKEVEYGLVGNEIMSYHQMHKKWGMPQGKKIILTTDQNLIKDGVQAIDDEFLEWFVDNPSCEFVKVEITEISCIIPNFGDVDKYKIIIPKEESKSEVVEWFDKFKKK